MKETKTKYHQLRGNQKTPKHNQVRKVRRLGKIRNVDEARRRWMNQIKYDGLSIKSVGCKYIVVTSLSICLMCDPGIGIKS